MKIHFDEQWNKLPSFLHSFSFAFFKCWICFSVLISNFLCFCFLWGSSLKMNFRKFVQIWNEAKILCFYPLIVFLFELIGMIVDILTPRGILKRLYLLLMFAAVEYNPRIVTAGTRVWCMWFQLRNSSIDRIIPKYFSSSVNTNDSSSNCPFLLFQSIASVRSLRLNLSISCVDSYK